MGILPILLTHTWIIHLESQSSRTEASPPLAGPLEGKPGLAKDTADGQYGGRPREQAVGVGSCLFSWSTALSASSNSALHMLSFLPLQTRIPSQSSTSLLRPGSQEVTCLSPQIKHSDQGSFFFLSWLSRQASLAPLSGQAPRLGLQGKTSLPTQSTGLPTPLKPEASSPHRIHPQGRDCSSWPG